MQSPSQSFGINTSASHSHRMNPHDALLSHVVSQTISSLTFLQSQNILKASPELDQIRNQLISRQHGGLAADFGMLSIGTQEASNRSNHQSIAGPSTQPPLIGMPELPPRHSQPFNLQEGSADRAVALWDYSSKANGDLSFRKDDVVIVDEEGELRTFTIVRSLETLLTGGSAQT